MATGIQLWSRGQPLGLDGQPQDTSPIQYWFAGRPYVLQPTVANVSFNLVAASATGAVASFSVSFPIQNVPLVAVSATGVAGPFVVTIPLTGVAATGFAAPPTGFNNAVSLQAVAATGAVKPLFPTLDFINLPLITIMNNKPIPIAANMNRTPIAMSASMPSQLPLAVIIE